ncbi:CoA transferase [Candidatus Poriferisocius sp.]|uniref:CaiB/BaiF CoA-transferase family protein n=1 Tax=Candidatus Poriferisocius sp. TaxID=3101276 RepID=UPI003B014161
MRPGALEGLRVVDHTDMRGALCGRVLGDLGAEIIRVPPIPDAGGPAHAHRNANKAMGDPADLEALIAGADLLIDNSGLDYVELAGCCPALVVVALTDMGLTGPRSGWRLEPLPAFASSGAQHLSGFMDRSPCWHPGYIAHDCASVLGALGGLAAVMGRSRHGRGQVVEISVQEAALGGLNPWSVLIPDYLAHFPELPAKGHRNADGNYWIFPARDGWVRTVIGTPKQWNGFVEVLGGPDALTGPEWSDGVFRARNRDVIHMVADGILAQHDRVDLFERGLAAATTIGVIQSPREFVAHPQVVGRGFFRHDVEGSEGLPVPDAPWKLSATPAGIRRRAPMSTDEPARFSPRASANRWAPGSLEGSAGTGDLVGTGDLAGTGDLVGTGDLAGAGGLLLAGVRVVEFGVAAVVPEATWMLSELGADVIKIESVVHPDSLRLAGRGDLNKAFPFNAESRGRRSVALDLTTDRGLELARELCTAADVVAENLRGGSLDKLGLGWDDLSPARPDLVYVCSQGYGRGGPMGRMPAYGPLNSGFAGAHWLWNHADVEYPCSTSLNHPDHIAGKLLAVAVLAAIHHRRRTGQGQLIDMAQTEAAAYLIGEVYMAAAATGADPRPIGNRSETVAPHDVYRAGGDDDWVALACHDDESWRRCCGVIGIENHWPTTAARLANGEAVDAAVSAWMAGGGADDRAERLQAAGVSAMAVMGPFDHRSDEHLAARGALDVLEHPVVGRETHVANPIRFGLTARRTAGPSPLLGADTVEVLGEVLGMTPDEVSALAAAGVCR